MVAPLVSYIHNWCSSDELNKNLQFMALDIAIIKVTLHFHVIR